MFATVNGVTSRWAGSLVALTLRLRGLEVGKGLIVRGFPRLKIRGEASNIHIGSFVTFSRGLDLRNRENGKIFIDDHVVIDDYVRLVSARDGTIRIGEDSAVGPYTIINGGGSVTIGKKVLLAKNVSINANDHKHSRHSHIRDQGFLYADVVIEDDVWLGANVCINKGVVIRKGSIVGANAVVTRDTEAFSKNAGVPSRKIGERS